MSCCGGNYQMSNEVQVTPKNVIGEPPALDEGQTLMRYTGAYVAPTGLYLGRYAGFKGQEPIAVSDEDVDRMLTFGVWEVVKADAGGDASDIASDVTQQDQAEIQTAEDKLRATLDGIAQDKTIITAEIEDAPANAVFDVNIDVSDGNDDEDTPRRKGARKARADKE